MASRGGFLVKDSALRSRHPIRYHSQPKVQKKKKKKKPEWDDTVSDLSAHRATKEEQEKRRQIHKSKNIAKAQQELKEKGQKKVTTPETPEAIEQRKLAIFHEVLYGRQDELQDVLAESDRTLSVVKDMFGDDPKKYLGFPNMTAAPPQRDSQSVAPGHGRMTAGPVAGFPDTPTHLSLLSDSVMRTPALNELPDHEQDPVSSPEPSEESPNNGGDSTTYPSSEFESRLDLHRFQQFVSEERGRDAGGLPGAFVRNLEGRMPDANIPQPCVPAQRTGNAETRHLLEARNLAQADPSFMSQVSGVPEVAVVPTVMKSVPVSTGEVTNMERIPSNDRSDTRNIKGSKPAQNKPKTKCATPQEPAGRGFKNLDDLKKMVENLEHEISDYERETGRQPSVKAVESGSFTGYTAALITSITKLMAYLKESETQRRAEMVMRESILEGFAEQRALIDALTNDLIQSQECNMQLQEDLRAYKNSTDEQLQYLKRELHAVLKSYEYQALSSTMDMLYSLKPLHEEQQHQSGSSSSQCGYLAGAPQTVKSAGQMAAVKPSSFIPVTSFQGQSDSITPMNAPSNVATAHVVPGSASRITSQGIDAQGSLPDGQNGQPFAVVGGHGTGDPTCSASGKVPAMGRANHHFYHIQQSAKPQDPSENVGPGAMLPGGPISEPPQVLSDGFVYGPSTRPLQASNGPPGGQQLPAPSQDPSVGPSGNQGVSPLIGPQIVSKVQAPNQATVGASSGDHRFGGSTLGPRLLRSSPQTIGESQRVPGDVQHFVRQNQGLPEHKTMQQPYTVNGGILPDRGVKAVAPAANNQTQSEAVTTAEGPIPGRDGITFGKGLLGGPLMNGDLRQRLQSMANRQRTDRVLRMEKGVVGQGSSGAPASSLPSDMESGSYGLDAQHKSPHVHFHEPVVVHNFANAAQAEVSPAVSPIPNQGREHNTGVFPEKRVVVSVPRVWQE